MFPVPHHTPRKVAKLGFELTQCGSHLPCSNPQLWRYGWLGYPKGWGEYMGCEGQCRQGRIFGFNHTKTLSESGPSSTHLVVSTRNTFPRSLQSSFLALQNSPAGAFLPVLRSESMGTPALPNIVPDLNLTTITGLQPDPAEKKGEKGKGKKKRQLILHKLGQ